MILEYAALQECDQDDDARPFGGPGGVLYDPDDACYSNMVAGLVHFRKGVSFPILRKIRICGHQYCISA